MYRRLLASAADRILESPTVHAAVEPRSVGRTYLVSGDHPAVTAVRRYNQSETTTFAEPKTVGPLPEVIERRPRQWTAPEWVVCECNDVQLVGPDGLSIVPGGDVLLENSLDWTKRAVISAIRSLIGGSVPVRSRSPETELESAVSLVGPWTDNYYHWHVDYLSRLAPLVEAEDLTPPLLLPSNTTSWMKESLQLLGYTENDWVVLGSGRTAVDTLVVPTLPRETAETAPGVEYLEYTYNPASIRVLATEMRSRSWGSLPEELRDMRRVFVSRQGAGQRFVRNLQELRPILSEHDIRLVRPEEYTIEEQVQLFSNVDVVVGPHGAGLTNLLFTDNPSCIELFGEYVHPAFYALARQLGIDYVCVTGNGDGHGMVVPPGMLRDALKCMVDD